MGFNKAAGDQLPASELNSFYASAGLYGASSAGTDAYAITVTPAPNDYDNGDTYTFKADVVNTGAATLNVNGLGAKSLVKYGNQPLLDGNIAAGSFVKVVFDASNDVFQVWSTVLEGYQVSSGYWDFVYKLPSDFVVTNGGLTDVPGFSFPAGASDRWYIEIRGATSGNNTTGDAAGDLITTGTWVTTNSFVQGTAYNGSGAIQNLVPQNLSSSNAALGGSVINSPMNNGDGQIRNFHWTMQLEMSGAGNIKMQFGNFSAASGRTSTLKAGTYIMARKLSI